MGFYVKILLDVLFHALELSGLCRDLLEYVNINRFLDASRQFYFSE